MQIKMWLNLTISFVVKNSTKFDGWTEKCPPRFKVGTGENESCLLAAE